MPQVTITITDAHAAFIRHHRSPDRLPPRNTYGEIGALIYDALPPLHPFKAGDVVYLDGNKTKARLVQRAGHSNHGHAVIDVVDQDGNVTRGVPAQYYTKEIKDAS